LERFGVRRVSDYHIRYIAAVLFGLIVSCGDSTGPDVRSAARLAFAEAPRTGLVEGDTFGIAVVARDSQGRVASAFAEPVTLTIAADPPGATLGGVATVNAIAGRATFTGLSLDRNGIGYALVASAPGLRPDTSARFDVGAAPVALLFIEQPNDAYHADEMPSFYCTFHACFSFFRVAAVDRFGNIVTAFHDSVTVTLGRDPVGELLDLRLAAQNGVAKGSVGLDRGAGFTLLARSGTLTPAESRPFTFSGEAPDHLGVVTPYPPPQAGTPFDIRVGLMYLVYTAAEINGGFVVITVDSGPSGAVLTGATRAPIANGAAVFSGMVAQRGGRYLISAAQENGGLRSSHPGRLDVVVGPLHVVFPGPMLNRQTGRPFPVSIEMRDAFGNRGMYPGSVSLALGANPSGATLGGTLTASATDSTAVFSGVTIDRPGVGYTLVASAPDLLPGESAPFDVSELALVFVTPPPAVSEAGTLPEVVAEVRDLAGNRATTFANAVRLTLAAGPSGAVLGGTTTVPAIEGVARFGDLRLTLAGPGYRLIASASGAGAATSDAFTINPGAGVGLVFVAQPIIRHVGSPAPQPRVEATVALVDSLTNVVPSFTGTVTLRLAPHPTGSDTLFGPYQMSPAAGTGLAAFSVTRPWMPGSDYHLIAEAPGFAPVSSAPFVVPVREPVTTRPTVQPPATVTAGSPFSVTFAVVDGDGFPLPDTVSVHLELLQEVRPGEPLAGRGAVPGAVARSTGGVATFPSVVLQTAGTRYYLEARATYQASEYSIWPSIPFSVVGTGGLWFVVQPTIQRVGSPVPQPRVEATVALVDSLANVVPSFTGTVTLRLAPHPTGSDTLFGPYQMSPAAGTGLAAFSVTRPWMPGSDYHLTAEAPGFAPVSSAPFVVPVQDPVTTRPRTQPPVTVTAGLPFAVAFDVADGDGFPLPDTVTVYLELLQQPQPGQPTSDRGPVPGAVARNIGGVATFPSVVLQTAGTLYSLEARATYQAGWYFRTSSIPFSVVAP
jgi:hypothetical protein